MTYTFSSRDEFHYPTIGACDVCGERLTKECHHTQNMEDQEWLAAYLATEQNSEAVDYFILNYRPKHAVDEAQRIEREIDAEWQAEMVARHAEWLDEERTLREAAQ